MVRALCRQVPYLDVWEVGKVGKVGFDFENLGNIEFSVGKVGLWDTFHYF